MAEGSFAHERSAQAITGRMAEVHAYPLTSASYGVGLAR